METGANYLYWCRRLNDQNDLELEELSIGVQAVCQGALKSWQRECWHDAPGNQPERSSLVTITSLQRPAGGAVVLHQGLGCATEREATLGEGEACFRMMADAAPAMIRTTGPATSGRAQPHRLAFTGRTLEEEHGGGWAWHSSCRSRTLLSTLAAAFHPPIQLDAGCGGTMENIGGSWNRGHEWEYGRRLHGLLQLGDRHHAAEGRPRASPR